MAPRLLTSASRLLCAILGLKRLRAGREQRATLSAELKSAGNDAFGTEDWDRALQCYARSVSLADPCCKVSAKTYSNLAATLCKLSLFDDAKACAKRSTQVDPA